MARFCKFPFLDKNVVRGQYYKADLSEYLQVVEMCAKARDEELAKELWVTCEKLTSTRTSR